MRQYSTALRIAPECPIAVTACMAHEWNGHLDLAIEMYRKRCELLGDAPYSLSCLAHALAVDGDTSEARQLMEKLKAGPIAAASDLARVYCGFRDVVKTFHYWRKRHDRSACTCCELAEIRGFDWLLPEPRFRAVLDQMGLPLPHWVRFDFLELFIKS